MRDASGTLTAALLVLACGFAGSALAQGTPAAPPPTADTAGPAIGSIAPDFELPGATRYGLLSAPVRLSDFRGKTVVLAFFFQARTRG